MTRQLDERCVDMRQFHDMLMTSITQHTNELDCGIAHDFSNLLGSILGLAAVHGIVTAHGGTIELADETGVGTCFSILLPLSESVAAV